jgi:hypothetical protein
MVFFGLHTVSYNVEPSLFILISLSDLYNNNNNNNNNNSIQFFIIFVQC